MGKFIDLTGQRFGRLTVLRVSGRTPSKKVKWMCKCDCGRIIEVQGTASRNGHTQSCGCLQKERASGANFYDLTGKCFGRLTALSAERHNGLVFWKCQCECGGVTVVRSTALLNGSTQSCGCLQREMIGDLNRTHGKSRERLYKIWENMLFRCYHANCKAYKYYGERGIAVCEEWRNSYETFRDWALSNGYRDDLTIDRIDNDKGYCPENCHWATWAEQAKNKRPRKQNI